MPGARVDQRADPAHRLRPARGRAGPSTVAVPEVGRARPRTQRIVVVLPEPLGPRKPVTRPGWMVTVRSSTATRAPYRLVRPASSITGSAWPAGRHRVCEARPLSGLWQAAVRPRTTRVARPARTGSRPSGGPMPPARTPDQTAPRTVSPTGVGYDGPKDGPGPARAGRRHAHHAERRPHPRQRPLAQGGPARPGPPRGLPPAREDHALRPRADPGARGARPRRRRARRLHRQRRRREGDPGRRPGREGPRDAGLRPVLHRAGLARLGRHRPRHPRIRDEVLHEGGHLGPGRQQHAGLLHPGRDQVPRHHPRGQAAPRPGDPAGAVGARHLLGLRHPPHRGHPPHDLEHERPGHPAQLPDDGGLRRPHLPAGQRRRARPCWSSSTGSRGSACTP